MRHSLPLSIVMMTATLGVACTTEQNDTSDVETDTSALSYGVHTISNFANGQCTTSHADGSIVTAACVSKRDAGEGRLGSWAQRWTLRNAGGSSVQLRDGDTGDCLGIEGGRTDNGAHAVLQPCDGRTAQLFEQKKAPKGPGIALVAKHSGMCLDVELDTGNVVQWDCHFGDKQLWSFEGPCFRQAVFVRFACHGGRYPSSCGDVFAGYEEESWPTLAACNLHPPDLNPCGEEICDMSVCLPSQCNE